MNISKDIVGINALGNPETVRFDKGGNMNRGPVGNVLPTGVIASGDETPSFIKDGISLSNNKHLLKEGAKMSMGGKGRY